MGSTGTHREPGLSHRAFFEEEFPTSLREHGRIVACATEPASGGDEWQHVFYAAVTNTSDHPHRPGITWALVILMHTDRTRGEHYNFTYKDLDENMGPGEDTCPEKILKLLTPTDHEYANNWRERCRAHNARRSKAGKVTHGQIVRFLQPLEFSGGHGRAQQFRCVREGRTVRWLALDDNGNPRFRCRIRRWRDLRFEVVDEPDQAATGN